MARRARSYFDCASSLPMCKALSVLAEMKVVQAAAAGRVVVVVGAGVDAWVCGRVSAWVSARRVGAPVRGWARLRNLGEWLVGTVGAWLRGSAGAWVRLKRCA